MKNILVAVHSPKIKSIISRLITKSFNNSDVTYCENYDSSINTMINTTIDVFLIEDFLVHNYSEATMGFKLMEKIREIEKYKFTPIFFFSNLEKSSLYAYEEFHCFGCYEYPFNINSLHKNMKIALSYQSPRNNNTRLHFKKDGLIFPIPINTILYIQCNRKGTYLQCMQSSLEEFPYRTCRQILNLLDSSNFIQCNKSTIVNKNQIKTIDLANQMIVLNNTNTSIELGLSYKNNIFHELEITQ